jgi:very-short-patch-repair endonuclease
MFQAGSLQKMGNWNPMGLFFGFMLFFGGIISIIGIISIPASAVFGSILLLFAFVVILLSHSTTSLTLHPRPPTSMSKTPYEIKTQKAEEMRNNPTPAERRMREILNINVTPNFPDHMFYSQSVQYGYILDFYCPTLKLAIEVDGESHNNRQGYDWQRDSHLQDWGIQVLRTSNTQVFNNPEDLVNSLNKIIEEKSQQTSRNIYSPNSRKTPYYRAPPKNRYSPRRY